jgi:hypothetical protein
VIDGSSADAAGLSSMERITPGRKESPNQRPEWYPGVAATWVFEITGAGARGAACIIRPRATRGASARTVVMTVATPFSID